MPHKVSPTMSPAIVPKSSGDAPNPEDISSLVSTVFTSKTSQGSLDASYAVANAFITSSIGFRGLNSYGIIDEIRSAATDKKNGGRREGSMFLLGALFERFPPAQAMSEVVFLLQHGDLLPLTIDLLADKTPAVREGAQYALDAIYTNLKPEARVIVLLPVLQTYLGKRSGKWQGTVGAYRLICKMAEDSKMGMGTKDEEEVKDVIREAMGKRLESLIPVVEAGMHDLKTEVRDKRIHKLRSANNNARSRKSRRKP
jgi:elongation factor 3